MHVKQKRAAGKITMSINGFGNVKNAVWELERGSGTAA